MDERRAERRLERRLVEARERRARVRRLELGRRQVPAHDRPPTASLVH